MEKTGAANTALIWEHYNPDYDFKDAKIPTTDEIKQKLKPFCETHRVTLENDRMIISDVKIDNYMLDLNEISFRYDNIRGVYDLNEALFIYVGKQITYCLLKDSPVDVLRITFVEELENEYTSVMISKWRNFETLEKFYRKLMTRMSGRMQEPETTSL